MTDAELDQIAQRIAENPALRQDPDTSKTARFFLSDNFKWLAVTVVIPLSTFLYGQAQQRIADKDRLAEAELSDARNNVAAMTALLPALADPDSKKVKLALIVLDQLKNAQHGEVSTLAGTIEAIRALADNLQLSSDPGERQRGAELQEAYSAATGAKPVEGPVVLDAVRATVVEAATAAKPRIVYLQIFGDTQRDGAEAVQAMLRDNGIGAPGIENVSDKLAGHVRQLAPQIRYFSDGDIGRASWLAANLPQVQGQSWSVVRARARGVPEGQLELWWPFPPKS